MEGAQALERRAGLLQLNGLADNVGDRQTALYLGSSSSGRDPTSRATRTSAWIDPRVTRRFELPETTEGLSSLDRPKRGKSTP